jgi:hypothetical protein
VRGFGLCLPRRIRLGFLLLGECRGISRRLDLGLMGGICLHLRLARRIGLALLLNACRIRLGFLLLGHGRGVCCPLDLGLMGGVCLHLCLPRGFDLGLLLNARRIRLCLLLARARNRIFLYPNLGLRLGLMCRVGLRLLLARLGQGLLLRILLRLTGGICLCLLDACLIYYLLLNFPRGFVLAFHSCRWRRGLPPLTGGGGGPL